MSNFYIQLIYIKKTTVDDTQNHSNIIITVDKTRGTCKVVFLPQLHEGAICTDSSAAEGGGR